MKCDTFEYLTATNATTELKWVAAANGKVPPNAVTTGKEGATALFIGRARHEGLDLLGKVFSPHGCIYVPYYGKEYKMTSYEVLTSA